MDRRVPRPPGPLGGRGGRILIWLLALGIAWAQDPVDDLTPPPEPGPATPYFPAPLPDDADIPLDALELPEPIVPDENPLLREPPDPYEVVVYGEGAIRQARADVVSRMDELGWEAVRWDGGEVTFRPPAAWMGRAHLTPDGLIRFGRPVLKVGAVEPSQPHYRTDQILDRTDQFGTVDTRMFLLPTRERLARAEAVVLEAVEEDLRAYRARIQQTEFWTAVNAMPNRLDELWLEGRPLVGDLPLETHAERRRAVLSFWADRADTPEGEALTRVVEVWLNEVVQTSAHPITVEERRWAEARRRDGRRLRLTAP